MAYTASIKSRQLLKDIGRYEVIVEFNDGTNVFDKTFMFGFDVTIDQVKKNIKTHLDRLEAAEVEITNIPNGVVDLVGVDTSTSIDEQAYITWTSNLQKLTKLQRLVDLGVLTGQETQIANLQNNLKTNFKVEYLNRL